MATGGCLVRTQRTEDELFGWGKHVDGKCHLILVDLEAHPAHEAGQNPEEEGHGCREEIVVVRDSVAGEIYQGCSISLLCSAGSIAVTALTGVGTEPKIWSTVLTSSST